MTRPSFSQYGGEVPLSAFEAIARAQSEELNARSAGAPDPLSIEINRVVNHASLIIGAGKMDTTAFNNEQAMEVAKAMADRAVAAVRDRLTERLAAMTKAQMARVREAMAAKDLPGAVAAVEKLLKAVERVGRVQAGDLDALKDAADEIAQMEFIEERDRGGTVRLTPISWAR